MSSLNAALAGVTAQLAQAKITGGGDKESARGDSVRKPSPEVPAASRSKDLSDDDSDDGSGGGGGEEAPILVFCRIRPSRGAAASRSVLAVDTAEKKVEFNLSKANADSSYNTVNNSREQFKFHFNGLFDESTTQEDIFEGVGKRVLENVTAGYNGRNSNHEWQLEQRGRARVEQRRVVQRGHHFCLRTNRKWKAGGTDRYEDRGLIPRTLTYLFDWIAKHSELSVTLRISYLEIYNDKGYDLLDPAHESKSLEELPRVILLEGERGAVHFKNLGELPAQNVDEALNLLFVGETNRVVCETPSNDASTRSHCIFIISLEVRTSDGKVRRSKLNLVDLAGSERVKKTGVGGKILTEACLAPDTGVALWDGGLVRAQQVRPGMHLVGQFGEAIPVRANTAMPTGAMYRLEYGLGACAGAGAGGSAHSVSAAHLVTVRWGRDPEMRLRREHSVDSGDVLRARITWLDRKSLQVGSASFRFGTGGTDVATGGACPALLPLLTPAEARRFMLVWLAELEASGRAWPLYMGDVVDIPAERLALLFRDSSMARRSFTLPRVARAGAKEKEAAPLPTSAAAHDAVIPPAPFVADDADKENSAPAPVLCNDFAIPVPCAELVKIPASLTAGDEEEEQEDHEGQGSTWPGEVALRALEKMGIACSPASELPPASERDAADDVLRANNLCTWLVCADPSAPGSLAYVPADALAAAPAAVDYVYMLPELRPLHTSSKLLPAGDARPFAIRQLERAWSELAIDAGASNVVLSDLNNSTGQRQHRAKCLAAMSAAVALVPRVIVAFGQVARERWVANFTHLPLVRGGELEREVAEDGGEAQPLCLRLHLHSDAIIRVVFSAHPAQGWWLSDVKAALAYAHGVPSHKGAGSGQEQDHVALAGIARVSDSPSCAIEVDSLEQRFVLGDRVLTHNCAINVSLHYLEQVIVALHEQAAGKTTHIPYRNSMLTSVLRASLGGSCRTVMVATLSPEKGHVDESISTSRFATRVAMIKNKALLNEEIDPYELVKKLKGHVRTLREELAVARGDAGAKFRPLDEQEGRECDTVVAAFLRDDRDKAYFDEDGSGAFQSIPMANPYRVRRCFEAFKAAYLGAGRSAALDTNLAPATAGALLPGTDGQAPASAAAAAQEIARLQRENQALAEALRKHAGTAATDALLVDLRKRPRGPEGPPSGAATAAAPGPGPGSRDRDREREREREQAPRSRDRGEPPGSSVGAGSSSQARGGASSAAPTAPAPTPAELALARARAESFESFRRSYRKHQLIEEQKATHAAKVEVARRTGESINAIRNEINSTKSRIEAHRLARGLATLGEEDPSAQPGDLAPDAAEQALRQRIEVLKQEYRQQFEGLKALKTEIDYLKHVVEKARAQLQADFERWWATQPQSGEAQAQAQMETAGDAQQQRSSSSHAASDGQASARSRPEYPSAPAPRIMADSAAAVAAQSQGGAYRSSTRQPAEAWGSAGAAPLSSSSSASSARAAAAVASVPISAWSSSGNGSGGGSGSVSAPSDAPIPGGLRTTGNSSADADIARFYALKEEMMRQRQQQQPQR